MEGTMSDEVILIAGAKVPRFLYGTAWKEDATQQLTELALRQGFRAIDTANQRRHYHEAGVGQAVAASIAGGLFDRREVFLQTKFTFRAGQDHRLPYDPAAPIAIQVEQSLASSLQHLNTDYVDSYLLHGPMSRGGLTEDDWAAWRAIEGVHRSGRARSIGVSNFTLEQLAALVHSAEVPPRFVQNRCFAATGWDRHVREFCSANGIVYQGFSLLTANRNVLAHPEIARIAERHGRSIAQVVFRFALDIGMMPLTGTTSADHMRADLQVFDFRLEADELSQIARLGMTSPE
jgi:diketogulonate reductase-like aldo/keto reductase